MATKLTLRLDEGVIRDAKRAARARGISLSEMVSGYFRAVCKGKTVKMEATPVLFPATINISRKNTGEGRPVRHQLHYGHLP
jgi:hypothetical protein